MDFSSVFGGLSAATAISSMIAAGALVALLGFAIWAVKQVASFFDGDTTAAEDGYSDSELAANSDPRVADDYDHACRRCGNYVPDPAYKICPDCER